MKKIRPLVIILFISGIINWGCQNATSPENDPDPPLSEIPVKNYISGQVILENQSENSNCLIYAVELQVGTGSDSAGYYKLDFSDSATTYSGKVTLLYYLIDYFIDTAYVQLDSGLIQYGEMDADSSGLLPEKFMKQYVLVEGWVSSDTLEIGELFTFTARFTNVSKDKHLHGILYFCGDVGDLGFSAISSYPGEMIFGFPKLGHAVITHNVQFGRDPGGYYQGRKEYYFPDGRLLVDVLVPIEPGNYVMAPYYYYYLEKYQISREMRIWINNNWEKYHRYDSPTYPKPQKFITPTITLK